MKLWRATSWARVAFHAMGKGRLRLPDPHHSAQEALKPVNSAARDVVAQLQRLLGQQPDLSFPITAAKAQTWLINTFLDEARPARVRVEISSMCSATWWWHSGPCCHILRPF